MSLIHKELVVTIKHRMTYLYFQYSCLLQLCARTQKPPGDELSPLGIMFLYGVLYFCNGINKIKIDEMKHIYINIYLYHIGCRYIKHTTGFFQVYVYVYTVLIIKRLQVYDLGTNWCHICRLFPIAIWNQGQIDAIFHGANTSNPLKTPFHYFLTSIIFHSNLLLVLLNLKIPYPKHRIFRNNDCDWLSALKFQISAEI